MNLKKVILPQRHIFLQDRQVMRKGHPVPKMTLLAAAPPPPVTLPVDWGKSLNFPMDLNDALGICMIAAAAHGDNTFTGANGAESFFDLPTLKTEYLTLSGGDNGLDEGQLIGEWKKGIGGIPAAHILDAIDIDPNDAPLMQATTNDFGGVIFMLALPDPWINNFTGNGEDVWDSPATADQQNGHGVWINGVDINSRYKVRTWGSSVWLTKAGVAVCDPSAFAVFSLRWFNAAGYAPNGKHYVELAVTWHQRGGMVLPPSPFPPPGPTPPPNPPPNPPTPGTGKVLAEALVQTWTDAAIAAFVAANVHDRGGHKVADVMKVAKLYLDKQIAAGYAAAP